MSGWTSACEAEVVRLARAAGAIVIGKTIMHEFALGQGHVPTRNALSPDLFPGGSSAGSAVSVAIGSSYGSIGTESAGSVRIPAALNGIVGIKPTFGRMSRYGVIPGNGSLDHMGILARSVKDAAFLLSALNGYDPKDVASLNEPQASFAPSLMRSDRPRVGVAVQMFADVDADGVRVAEAALDSLTSDGAELVEVSDLPVAEMRAVTEVLLSAEAAPPLQRRRRIRRRGGTRGAGRRREDQAERGARRGFAATGSTRQASTHPASQRAVRYYCDMGQ